MVKIEFHHKGSLIKTIIKTQKKYIVNKERQSEHNGGDPIIPNF